MKIMAFGFMGNCILFFIPEFFDQVTHFICKCGGASFVARAQPAELSFFVDDHFLRNAGEAEHFCIQAWLLCRARTR